jgi:hypothetical protein
LHESPDPFSITEDLPLQLRVVFYADIGKHFAGLHPLYPQRLEFPNAPFLKQRTSPVRLVLL